MGVDWTVCVSPKRKCILRTKEYYSGGEPENYLFGMLFSHLFDLQDPEAKTTRNVTKVTQQIDFI